MPTILRATIAVVVPVGSALLVALGVLGDARNLMDLFHVEVPLHDGRLSDVEKGVVSRAFREYSADSNYTKDLPETFEDYLVDQNPEFETTLTSLVGNAHSDIIIVHAAGGYGKSALMEKIVGDLVGGNSKTIDLAGDSKNAETESRCKPDLKLHGKIVNTLPYAGRIHWKSLADRISSFEVELLVLDGGDEIHYEAAKELLDTLSDQKESFGSTDIVLFTRSELIDELISRDKMDTYVMIPRVALKPHRITQASLPLRVKNYQDYLAASAIEDRNAVDTDGDGIIDTINDQATVDPDYSWDMLIRASNPAFSGGRSPVSLEPLSIRLNRLKNRTIEPLINRLPARGTVIRRQVDFPVRNPHRFGPFHGPDASAVHYPGAQDTRASLCHNRFQSVAP